MTGRRGGGGGGGGGGRGAGVGGGGGGGGKGGRVAKPYVDTLFVIQVAVSRNLVEVNYRRMKS